MKSILCPCEDITRREVEDAIGHGYASLEDVKRFTGLATGTCQGRLCLAPTIRLIAERTGTDPARVGLIRFRPPIEPVALGVLAAEDGAKAP